MSVGVFRQDWRPQLAPSRLGPLAPAGGGTVLPTTASGTLAQNPAVYQRTAFNPLLKAAGVAVFAVAASVYTPPKNVAVAITGARADLTAQQFEIGSEYAPFDPGDDIIVGPDKQGQYLFARTYDSQVQPQKMLGALIGSVAASAYFPSTKLPQVSTVAYSQPFVSAQQVALLPIGGGQMFAGNNIVSLPNKVVDLTAAQWSVGEETAAIFSAPQTSAYVAPALVLANTTRIADLTAQTWSLIEEPAAVITFAPSSSYVPYSTAARCARAQIDLSAQQWLLRLDQTPLLPVGGGSVFAGMQIARTFASRLPDVYLPLSIGQAIYSQTPVTGYVPASSVNTVQSGQVSYVPQQWLMSADNNAALFAPSGTYVYASTLHLARHGGLDRAPISILFSPLAAQLWIAPPPPPSTSFVTERMAIVEQEVRVAIVLSTARNITIH